MVTASEMMTLPVVSFTIVKACKISGVNATYCEIDSDYGHDAFLLETEQETHLIKHFLQKVFYAYEVTGDYGA